MGATQKKCNRNNKLITRLHSKIEYYDPDSQYLLKKYLKRHKQQLADCIEREKELKKLIDISKGDDLEKAIMRLSNAQAKRLRLKGIIEEETNKLNQKQE